MGVGDHQLHPRQAAGDQPAHERQPARAVLGGGDVQVEDLPVPVAVDAGREQGVHVDYAAVFTDFHREGVDPHERVGAGIEGAGTERGDLGVEVGGHLADLRPGQGLDPSCSANFSTRRVETPSRYAVATTVTKLVRRGGGGSTTSRGTTSRGAASVM